VKQALLGISVLVTRPKPAATRLAQLIRQQGGNPICQPGVELGAMSDAEPSLDHLLRLAAADIVIFTSANAVRFALQRKPASDWPAAATLVAIGQRTATTLAASGLDAVLAPAAGADSESVLQLPLLQQVVGRKVLLACAPGGRQLLQAELTARGARVHPVFLYRRKPPRANPETLHEIKLAIDRLVVTATSVTILENITNLLGTGPLNRPLCVISTRIAERAQQLGYEQIHVASGPGDHALLTTVLDASTT
jgi:uroporphyrinogen-III synthase